MHPDVAHHGDHFRFKDRYFGTGPGASCFGDDVLSVAGDPGGLLAAMIALMVLYVKNTEYTETNRMI